MDISKFTTRTQEAIAGAIQAATAAGHRQLEALHLLDALLGQQETLVRPLLTAAGADPRTCHRSVTRGWIDVRRA